MGIWDFNVHLLCLIWMKLKKKQEKKKDRSKLKMHFVLNLNNSVVIVKVILSKLLGSKCEVFNKYLTNSCKVLKNPSFLMISGTLHSSVIFEITLTSLAKCCTNSSKTHFNSNEWSLKYTCLVFLSYFYFFL